MTAVPWGVQNQRDQAGAGNDRIAQLQQQGFTGQMVNPATGQLQQMTNGAWAAAPAAPAQTPATGAGGAPAAPGGNGIMGNPAAGAPSPLGDWASWFSSGGLSPGNWQTTGGVNAADWQGLGGGANLGFLDQFNQLLQGGANPTQVAPTLTSMYG